MGKIHHIIEAQQFNRELLHEIYYLTEKIADLMVKERKGNLSSREKKEMRRMQRVAKDKLMISLFFDPSTRTRTSLERGMKKLGGDFVSIGSDQELSVTIREKSLEDTVGALSRFFPDVIVLRHSQAGAAKRAKEVSIGVPIINAGDGINQHPSRGITDAYTIWENFRQIDGLSIAIVGNLLNSREIRSLCYLLGEYNVTIYAVSPDILKIGQDVKDHLDKHNVHLFEVSDLREVAGKANVVYQNRIQRTLSGGDMLILEGQMFSHQEIKEKYSINDQVLGILPKDSIIMDLSFRPEDREFSNLEKDPRLVYYPQVQNGLFVHIALLEMILAQE